MGGRNAVVKRLTYRAAKYVFVRRLKRTKWAKISGSWIRVLMVADGQVLFNYLRDPLPRPIMTFVEYLDGWPRRVK